MSVAATHLNEPRSTSCARRAATARSPRSHPKPTLMYALTRIAPPVARWFAARTSDVLAK